MDHLKDVDIPPLLDLCAEINASVVEAVDIRTDLSCILNGRLALSLMRAVKQRLRIVDLQEFLFGKGFLRYVASSILLLCLNLFSKFILCSISNNTSSRAMIKSWIS